MHEIRANILSTEVLTQADAICVTTNGIVRRDGRAVMGAGVAKAFRDTFPDIDERLAQCLKKHGNQVARIGNAGTKGPIILSFPTKQDWKNPSNLPLIARSAEQLRRFADVLKLNSIWVPRPGCSNGGLNWADVKPILEPHFDDRFTICSL